MIVGIDDGCVIASQRLYAQGASQTILRLQLPFSADGQSVSAP